MDVVLRDCYLSALKVPRADTQRVPYSAVDARGYPLSKTAWIAMGGKTNDDETLCFFGKDVRTHAEWCEIFKLSTWGDAKTGNARMSLMSFLKLAEGRPEVWTMELDRVPKGPTSSDKEKLDTLEKTMSEALSKLIDAADKLGWRTMDTNALLATSLRTRSMHELLFAYNDAKNKWYEETRRQKEMMLEEEIRLQRNARIERVRELRNQIRKMVEIRVREMDCAPPHSAEEIRYLQMLEDAKRRANEEAKHRAEAKDAEEREAKRRAEAKEAEEREAKRRAEEKEAEEREAKRRAEEQEAKRKTEKEVKRKAKDDEAKRKAKDDETKRMAEEARRVAEEAEEARRRAEEAEEAQRRAEEVSRRVETGNVVVTGKKKKAGKGSRGPSDAFFRDENAKRFHGSSDDDSYGSSDEDAKAMLGM